MREQVEMVLSKKCSIDIPDTGRTSYLCLLMSWNSTRKDNVFFPSSSGLVLADKYIFGPEKCSHGTLADSCLQSQVGNLTLFPFWSERRG